MDGTAAYVYCVVSAASRPVVRRAPAGLAGATSPTLLEVAPRLWLAVADVPLRQYGSEALERGLRDMQWVADAAVAHEAVVEYFARLRGVTVVPMKLFTMFSTRVRAAASMRSRSRELRAVLKRLERCEEWGVRVLRQPGASTPPAGTGSRSSGAAFLRARKEARDRARDAVLAAAESAEDAYERLGAHAREARRRDDVPAGAPSPPLLDAAFLVSTSSRARFRGAARKAAAACAKAGAVMTLSGPWPAYNFVQGAEEAR